MEIAPIAVTTPVAPGNTVALVPLLRRHRALPERLRRLEARAEDLESRAAVVTPEVADALPPGRRIVSVELLDPIGLASTRTALARPVASIAPRVLDKIVHDQTIKTLREVLWEYADVRVVEG